MHSATYFAFRDELLKIAGVMDDAAAEYKRMMTQHASNPAFRGSLHTSEIPLAYKTIARTSPNATRAADMAQNFTKNPLRLGSVAAHSGQPINLMSKLKGGLGTVARAVR